MFPVVAALVLSYSFSIAPAIIITIEWSNKSETLWNVTRCTCFFFCFNQCIGQDAPSKCLVHAFQYYNSVVHFLLLSLRRCYFRYCSVFNIFATNFFRYLFASISPQDKDPEYVSRFIQCLSLSLSFSLFRKILWQFFFFRFLFSLQANLL